MDWLQLEEQDNYLKIFFVHDQIVKMYGRFNLFVIHLS